jgi:hypothetical protein
VRCPVEQDARLVQLRRLRLRPPLERRMEQREPALWEIEGHRSEAAASAAVSASAS